MVLTCARSCIVAPSKLTSIINEDRPWAWNSEYFEINIFISNDMLSTSLLKIPTENTLQKSAIKNIHCTGQIMFLLNLWKLNCDKQSLYLCAVLFASKSNIQNKLQTSMWNGMEKRLFIVSVKQRTGYLISRGSFELHVIKSQTLTICLCNNTSFVIGPNNL